MVEHHTIFTWFFQKVKNCLRRQSCVAELEKCVADQSLAARIDMKRKHRT